MCREGLSPASGLPSVLHVQPEAGRVGKQGASWGPVGGVGSPGDHAYAHSEKCPWVPVGGPRFRNKISHFIIQGNGKTGFFM